MHTQCTACGVLVTKVFGVRSIPLVVLVTKMFGKGGARLRVLAAGRGAFGDEERTGFFQAGKWVAFGHLRNLVRNSGEYRDAFPGITAQGYLIRRFDL